MFQGLNLKGACINKDCVTGLKVKKIVKISPTKPIENKKLDKKLEGEKKKLQVENKKLKLENAKLKEMLTFFKEFFKDNWIKDNLKKWNLCLPRMSSQTRYQTGVFATPMPTIVAGVLLSLIHI